jgi:hypothetical protein
MTSIGLPDLEPMKERKVELRSHLSSICKVEHMRGEVWLANHPEVQRVLDSLYELEDEWERVQYFGGEETPYRMQRYEQISETIRKLQDLPREPSRLTRKEREEKSRVQSELSRVTHALRRVNQLTHHC